MMIFAVSIFPLFAVHIWHASLILFYRGNERPETISHHAVTSTKTLKAHRIIHILVSILLVIFSIKYLYAEGYVVAGSLLIIGAFADAVEVMTLNKNTPFGPTVKDPHQLAAWIMALCFISYGILITQIAGLSQIVTNALWVVFLAMLINTYSAKFKKFWVSQMIYFTLLAIVISVAHMKLNF